MEFRSEAHEAFEAREAEKRAEREQSEAFGILTRLRDDAVKIHDEIVEKYADQLESVEERDLATYIKDRSDAKRWRIWTEYMKGGHPLDRDIELYANMIDQHEAATKMTGRLNKKDKLPRAYKGVTELEVERRNLHAKLIGKLQGLTNAYENAGIDKSWTNDINVLARFDVTVWAENVRDYLNKEAERRRIDDSATGSESVSHAA